MLEDFYHVEQEMLRYAQAPRNQVEHHNWVRTIYNKLEDFKRQGQKPQDYVLIELQGREEHNRAITKLVWRKKDNVNGK